MSGQKFYEIIHVRLWAIFVVIGCSYFILILRLLDISMTDKEDIKSIISEAVDYNVSQSYNGAKRADIVDIHGTLLATDVPSASLYAHPKQIKNKEFVAEQLQNILQNIGGKDDILKKLNSQKDFIWIKRHISPHEQQKINDQGLLGLYFAKDKRRFYPQNNLFSHILGYLDIDGKGISGLEYSLDAQLRAQSSKVVRLSVDSRIQHIVRDKLQKFIALHEAKGGAGIVMNAKTGEVISMVSLPDFDGNDKQKLKAENFFNRATLGVYENGSVQKALTIAMAINEGKVGVNDAFDVSKPMKIGNRFTIHDYKGKGGMLSVPEILIYSSNLGVAQIIKRVGAVKQKSYAKKLGMLDRCDIELNEVGRPLYPKWGQWNSEVYMTTISYGHGMAVTPLHMVQAIGSVVNGGYRVRPTLLKKPDASVDVVNDQDHHRIFSANTSEIMRKILRLVVKYGTGKATDVPGYFVGGKSGTAEVVSAGRYDKSANIANFIAAFPIYDPKYIIYISIDQAKPNNINYGYTTGGMIAAPLVGQIIRDIAPVMGVVPATSSAAIAKELELDFTQHYLPKQVVAKNE